MVSVAPARLDFQRIRPGGSPGAGPKACHCTDGKGEIDGLPSSPDFGSALKQQLGLALVPSKSQIDVLAIDHIERTPTEN